MKKREELTQKQQKLIAAVAFGVFLVLTALVCFYVGRPLLRFASEPENFRQWVEKYGFWGQLAYMGMVILQVIAALIPGEPFEIAAGYAFGAVRGTLLCLAASTAGSVIVFFLVKRYGIRLVEAFFPTKDIQSLKLLKLSQKRMLLFFIIFMLPGTPKDLLCYYAGLTDMKFAAMLFICSVGRIPAIVSSAVGGNALGTEKYLFAAIVFAASFAISAAGIAIYKRMLKRRGDK